MLKLVNPNGGETWVHETRLDEYLGRGFKLTPPPPPPPPKKKKTSKKEA